MQRSITVRVKRFGQCGLIICTTLLTTGFAPLCAKPLEHVEEQTHKEAKVEAAVSSPIKAKVEDNLDINLQTPATIQANQATYSLTQALSNKYLNRVKRYLNSPILGKFQLTSRFGIRKDPINGQSKKHLGIDLSITAGTPIIAVARGQVVKAGWHHAYGFNIEIEHSPRWRTRYAHARLLYVVSGQNVESGQFIGQVGSTGRSTGPHLHFEVWRNGEPIDPFLVVRGLPKSSNRH